MSDPVIEDVVPQCPVCHHPTRDRSWSVCADCVTRVDAALVGILDLHIMASTCLEPGTSSDGGPIGLHRDPPIPVDLGALDLSHGEGVLGILETWERWWREHWGLAPYGEASASRLNVAVSHGTPELASTATSRNLSGTVRFMRSWWPIAAAVVEPPPEEFADEVLRLHRECLAALHRIPSDLDKRIPVPPDWVILCPRDLDNGAICGHRIGVMRQPLPVDGQHAQPVTLNCERCGAHWDLPRLMLVAQASGTPVWVDAEAAAAHLGTTPRGLAPMVRAGRIAKRGNRYSVTRHADETSAV
jgi:hypothetical protein